MSKSRSKAIPSRNDVRELTATECKAVSGGPGYHTIDTPGGNHFAVWYDKKGVKHQEYLGNY